MNDMILGIKTSIHPFHFITSFILNELPNPEYQEPTGAPESSPYDEVGEQLQIPPGRNKIQLQILQNLLNPKKRVRILIWTNKFLQMRLQFEFKNPKNQLKHL